MVIIESKLSVIEGLTYRFYLYRKGFNLFKLPIIEGLLSRPKITENYNRFNHRTNEHIKYVSCVFLIGEMSKHLQVCGI